MKLANMIFASAFLVILSGCTVHFKPIHIQFNAEKPSVEKLSILGSPASGVIKWKKYIGTPTFQVSEPFYMVGGTPALLPDGKIYYQDEHHFYELDAGTGEIIATYEKPMRSETQQLDFENECEAEDEFIFPLVNYLSEKEYIVFDRINHKLLDSYTEGNYCQGKHIISIFNHGWLCAAVMREAESGKVLWKARHYFCKVDASDFDKKTTYLALRKGTSLLIRAYETDYDSNKLIGDTGKLQWQRTISGPNDAIVLVYKLDQLIISQFNLNQSGATNGKIISINPANGQVNWQLNNAIVMLNRYYENDGMVYALLTESPGNISAIDQKTGEEKQRFVLKDINYLYGIIVLADQLIFANTTESTNNFFVDFISAPPATYSVNSLSKVSFISVDKKTGNVLWDVNLTNLKQLLNYSEGILYFGGIADNYNKMFFAGGKKMKETDFVFLKKGMIPPNELLDRAYFIDAVSGRPLLTAVLEGNGENFVEKVFMKDNTAFIKSLSGWLYAVEIRKN